MTITQDQLTQIAKITYILVQHDARDYLDLMLKLWDLQPESQQEITFDDFCLWLDDFSSGEETMDTIPRAWLTGAAVALINSPAVTK
jgi:hypothetical protein